MKALSWGLDDTGFLASLAEILQILLTIISALSALFGGSSS